MNITYQKQRLLETAVASMKFTPNQPFLLSFVFAWGELKSFCINSGLNMERSPERTKGINELDKIQIANWRYGHLYCHVWTKELTLPRFKDKVRDSFELARLQAEEILNQEKEQIESALEKLQLLK